MNSKIIIDPFIALSVFGLSVISLFLRIPTSQNMFYEQLFFLFLGLIIYFIITNLDIDILKKFLWPLYFSCLVLLSLSFLGPSIRGAKRWIPITDNFSLQTSEIIKPFLIFIIAYLFTNIKGSKVAKILKTILIFTPFTLLVFRQPDLGNVIVYMFFFLVIEIASDIPYKILISQFLILLLILPFSWNFLQDYQKQRIISFANPTSDPSGIGYNTLQSIIAIGSGKFFGMGLGRGTQSGLQFLPEFQTDFVFAQVVEDLGFLGGLLVIVLFFILLSRILFLANNTQDHLQKLFLIGVFGQFFIQIFINIAMNLGVLPITGITLPFISYGGSSVLSSFISLAMVVKMSRYQNRIDLVIK
jgi:rod shape determining protein RodA